MTTSTSNPRRKKTSPGSTPVDAGTPEIGRHYEVAPEVTKGGVRTRVLDETEYDRMLMSERISFEEHSTLDGLAKRFHSAGFIGMGVVQLDRVGRSVRSGEPRAAVSNSQLAEVMYELDRSIGTKGRAAIVAMVIDDRPLPKWMDKKSIEKAAKIIDRVLG